MPTTLIKDLSLEDLIALLIHREKKLALSQRNKADHYVIQFNKRQLERVQRL